VHFALLAFPRFGFGRFLRSTCRFRQRAALPCVRFDARGFGRGCFASETLFFGGLPQRRATAACSSAAAWTSAAFSDDGAPVRRPTSRTGSGSGATAAAVAPTTTRSRRRASRLFAPGRVSHVPTARECERLGRR